MVGLALLGFAVYGRRLVKAGAGWYELWKRKLPLRPLAVQCWLGEFDDKLAAAFAALPGRSAGRHDLGHFARAVQGRATC